MSYVFVAVAYFAGGWEWAVIGALAFAVWWRFGSGRGAIPFSVVSGAWLLLFAISGDRRLFFPYAMQFAIQTACMMLALPARVGVGVSMIAAFLWLRIVQQASREVLLFELVVALGLLALALSFHRIETRGAVVAAIGSILACLSLAL